MLVTIAGTDEPMWLKVVAVVGVILSGLDLLVGFSRRADMHRDLKRRYVRLERDILKAPPVDQIRERRLDIEADEPPVYRALDLLCHNEVCAAEGISRKEHPEQFTALPWIVSMTANWIQWPNAGASYGSYGSIPPTPSTSEDTA